MRRTARALLSLLMVLPALVLLPAQPATAVNPVLSQIVSANPADWTPHILDDTGIVYAITQVGNQMVAGGVFTQVKQPGGPTLTRSNLFAFNATTGAINPNFAPTFDGEVDSLATDGTSLFVGGTFNTVNGLSGYKRLVKLNLTDGSIVTGFGAKITSGQQVWDMQVRGSKLYLGGAFTVVNDTARERLAAVDTQTGALDPNLHLVFAGKHNGGQVRVHRFDISPDGTRLMAIGNFVTVDGQDRRQAAMIDLTTTPATLANWETDRFKPQCTSRFDTYMRDVDFSPDGSYFILATTGAYMGGPNAGVLCDTVSRWTANASGTALQPEWVDYTGGDTTFAVAATGTAVYVGGHQRWWNNPWAGDRQGAGAVSRPGIAALDPLNGVPFQWNPIRNPRGLGVQTLVANAQGVWVGSDTDDIGAEYHAKIALMPLSGGSPVPPAPASVLPNDLYTLNSGTSLTYRSFTGTSLGASSALSTPTIDWSNARGSFITNGKLYTGWSDGHLYSRTFDGTSFGPAVDINLNGLTASYWPLSTVTGMFFTNGRIYYTVSGNTRLFYRYFTPESDIVGGQSFVASGAGDGLDWNGVSGMALASGRIYFAKNNNLYGINFANAAPVPGTQTTISGPAAGDGQTWSSRGMFVFGQGVDTFPPSQPGTPTASSTEVGKVHLTWGAASDSVSSTLTYSVYRSGTLAGTVSSASAGTVSFDDLGGTPGNTYIYTVTATDGAGNVGQASPASAPVTVLTADVAAPSVPGQPSGAANGKTAIDLTWAASVDDRGGADHLSGVPRRRSGHDVREHGGPHRRIHRHGTGRGLHPHLPGHGCRSLGQRQRAEPRLGAHLHLGGLLQRRVQRWKLRELDHRHATHDRRFAGESCSAQCSGERDRSVCLGGPRPPVDLSLRVREFRRQRHGARLGRPGPDATADGGQRQPREGAPVGRRHPAGQVRCFGDGEGRRHGPGAGLERDRAVRDRRHGHDVGPLPERSESDQRVDGGHGHHPRGADPDRRQRREDLHRELRRRDGGWDPGLRISSTRRDLGHPTLTPQDLTQHVELQHLPEPPADNGVDR